MYQLPELYHYLKRMNAGHLLDIATGEGDFLLFLLESFNSYESATGLDYNPETLNIAARKFLNHKVELIQGNVRKLPFEENYFNTVSVSNSLHHFDAPSKALQSMMRIIVPGGAMIINEMTDNQINPAQEAYLAYHTLKAEIDRTNGIYHRIIYRQEELLQILNESALQPAIQTTSTEHPIIDSKEKMWQFIHKFDDLISNVSQLPNGLEIERRAQEVKEMIQSDGFQRPPQIAFICYKD